jgi:signal peptide peptidase SppA
MTIRDFFDPRQWRRRGPVVAVLRFEGVILPRLRRGAISLGTHNAAIERAFALKGLAAVAIVINSPGGSAAQSALICRRLRGLAADKGVPVLAFAEDVAASGGYWLALAGDEIFGAETSIFGSIGVISAGFGFPGLIERLGIERRLHTAGSHKSLLDPFLPEDPAETARLAGLQRDLHESFKEAVRQRRAGRIAAADESLFNGDVFTGRMALARGLIDGIGELHEVVRARFGDDVIVRPIAVERRHGLRRLWPFAAGEPFAALGELVDEIEARLLWSRFGL